MGATEVIKAPQGDQPNTQNPANEVAKATGARERVPMSLPVQRLQVPEIPGFHCHWLRGDKQRIAQALRAGYVFVKEEEVELNRIGLGAGQTDSGNEGLGTNISVISGTTEKGDPQELYLMKLPIQYWREDQKAAAERQERMAALLRGDKGFQSPEGDNENRYSREEQKKLFARNVKPQRRPFTAADE